MYYILKIPLKTDMTIYFKMLNITDKMAYTLANKF